MSSESLRSHHAEYTTPDAVNDILALGRWQLAAIGRHLDELRRLTGPLLTGTTPLLMYEQMRLGDRLDEAVSTSSFQTLSLLNELRAWRKGLDPDQLAEVGRQQAEFDRITDDWRHLMQAVHHIWELGNLPQ